MMKKLFLLLFLSIVGMVFHSCSMEACGYQTVPSCRHTAENSNPDQRKQFVLSLPIGDMLHSGGDQHTRLSHLHQRTLRQLMLQWNKELMKDNSRHAQRMQALSVSTYDVSHYIGYEVGESLYIYRIRHIVI